MNMKLKSLICILLGLILVAPACAKEQDDRDELLRALDRTERKTREFVYTEDASGAKVIVTGKVEDDLRSQALLNLNAVDLGESIISDDAIALRFINPSAIPGFEQAIAAGFLSGSRIVGQAMLEGRWLIDYDGAPPLRAGITDQGSIAVGANPAVDSLYIFQYVRRAIEEGRTIWEFNADDLINYRKSEDVFDPPNEDLGIIRYDILPPQLPRRSERGSQSALPGIAHFRKMSFYVRNNQIVEIKELIDFERHPDFKRAREGTGPKYHLRILESVREGKAREPIRVREMSYRFINVGTPVQIQLPPDALPANLDFFLSGPPQQGAGGGGGPPQPGPEGGPPEAPPAPPAGDPAPAPPAE